MNPPDRPLPARERNRRSILEAAQDVLRRDPDATLDEVAARAGVVRRTLYGHFARRHDLVVALVRAAAAEYVAEVGPVPTEPDDVCGEAAATFLRHWDTARRHDLLITMARSTAADEVRAAMASHHESRVRLIEHGQRRGVFATHLPAGVLADLLENSAGFLLAAAGDGRWNGDGPAVALGHLLTLGVGYEQARDVVARAAAAG